MYHFGGNSTRGDKLLLVCYSLSMKFMGATISNVTYPALLRAILAAFSQGRSLYITTPNPEMLLMGRSNAPYQELLRSADFGVVDGFGLQLVLRLKGCFVPRITGVALLQQLTNDLSVPIVYVGNEHVFPAAHTFPLKNITPVVAPQLQTDAEIIAYAQELSQQIPLGSAVFIGLGMYKQELLGHELLKHGALLTMGVGGAFDMIAGVLPRAPRWVSSFGLEWMWRLWLQPSRFSRIVKAVIVFPCIALFYPVSYE